MEENQNQTPAPEKSAAPNVMLIIAVVGVLAVFGFMLTRSKSQNQNTTPVQGQVEADQVVTETDSQPVNVVLNPDLTVTVEGGEFYFKPNEIKVKVGQTVKIVFNDVQGSHDFVIDEFNVKTPQIKDPNTAEVTFVADQAGSFEYYCSVGKHRAMGMKGTLVVE
jgi:plastocyanin